MPSPSQDCLAFRVGDKPFLLPVSAVVEVLPMLEVAPMPDAPAPVLGAIVRRGSRIPVLDAGAQLGCPTVPAGGLDSYIVILESGGRQVGLLVTDVDGVVTLDMSGSTQGGFVTPRGLAQLLEPALLVPA